METKVDYSEYTHQELLQAREAIDSEAYPERTKKLDQLIANHNNKIQQQVDEENKKIIRESRAKYHGNAKEYFSIWIVNLLLTIVTLGLYSPWAKVRNNRYIYGNTEVDGHRFSYLADPVKILKGRLIAVAAFAAYYFAASASTYSGALLFAAVILVSPFLICQSLKFRMRVTSYRNVRFAFTGKYGRALVVFCIYPILSIFTLYLALPWAISKMDKFIIDNTYYGDRKFVTQLDGVEYFATSIISGIIAIPFFIALNYFGILEPDPATLDEFASYYMTALLLVCYAFIYALTNSFYRARIRNHIFNSSKLEDVAKFGSDVDFVEFAWINITNLLALILTLGLAMPWAQTRKFNYLSQCTEIKVMEGADSVLSHREEDQNAIGDEIADAFDLDVALG